MEAGVWVSLLIGAGVLGSIAFFVWATLRTGQDIPPFRPVWIVLLDGGIDGPDRPDGSDGGEDGHRPPSPRAPSRGGAGWHREKRRQGPACRLRRLPAAR